jgi:hypothetical protein
LNRWLVDLRPDLDVLNKSNVSEIAGNRTSLLETGSLFDILTERKEYIRDRFV